MTRRRHSASASPRSLPFENARITVARLATPVKEQLMLSANAVPRQGGQGMNLSHMIAGLGGLFDLSVFCQAGQTGKPTRYIPSPGWSNLLGRIPILRRKRDWIGLLSEMQFDRAVRRNLGTARYFQGTTGQCLESLAAARAKGCFTILDAVTLHGDFYKLAMDRECALLGAAPIQHSLMHRRVLAEYDRADAIRVMSQLARQTFLERGFAAERIFVAPPHFDIARFPTAEFRGSRFTISFVGMLEPAKGFHYLIEAFRKLNRPDAELILWGNTGTRPLQRYVREQRTACPAIQVRPDSVSQIGYEKVYGISSVLVHPSLADGFGYAVGEAMASGIPVITTTATGASQWIVDGVNGYIVPPRDVDAIRDRLEYLMDHPSRLQELGQAARETMAKLTIEHFQQCYLSGLAACGAGRTTETCQTLPQ
jgi:glycosyltransferase involved in cell wall biosynthesis